MTTNPLADALAELRREATCPTKYLSPPKWVIDAIFDAALSGDLMLRSEHLAALAAANEAAAHTAWPWRHQGEPDPVHQTGEWAKWRIGEAIRALTTADQQAALDAMISRAREVKPLVWKDYAEQGFRRADTPIGEYSVGFDDGWWAQLEGVEFWEWEPPEDPRCYSSPEAGMLACKADYTTRILAALADGEPT